MRLKILLLFLLISCSTSKELSSGEFNIYESTSFERVVIKPIVELSKNTFIEGEPITGKLYFENDTLLRNIATELNLEYNKSFFYYQNGILYDRTKIGEGVDTLLFNFTTKKQARPELDSSELDLGDEALAIKVQLKNKTHSFDTTFIQFFDIPWD